MRRWRVILLLCLLLGTVVNVLVAWGADEAHHPSIYPMSPLGGLRPWPVQVLEPWPAHPTRRFDRRFTGVTLSGWAGSDCGVLVWECGWPLRSLRRHAYYTTDETR